MQGEVKRIFLGLDVCGEPGLHGVEHPIYDIWLTDCKEPQQTIATAAPDPANKPATAPPPPAQKKAAPKQAVQQRPPQPLPPIQQQQTAPPPPPPPEQRPGLFGIPGFGRYANPPGWAARLSDLLPGSDDLERACARNRGASGEPQEIAGLAGERLVEQRRVAPPRNLDRAETLQMLGDVLRVEQLEAAMNEPRDRCTSATFEASRAV